jgi:hypothetical protein
MKKVVRVMLINMKGTRPLRGLPYPTFECGQYFNVKVKIKIDAVLTLVLTF